MNINKKVPHPDFCRTYPRLRSVVAGILCLVLLFVACFALTGCGNDSTPVGHPDFKFVSVETEEIIFTGYNILSINVEYEEGDETWEVNKFDGDAWHTEIAGQSPNRWYIKLTLDNKCAEKLVSFLSQNNSVRGSRDNFSFTCDYTYATNNSWIISRGSSIENAGNFADFLLGNISTNDYISLI